MGKNGLRLIINFGRKRTNKLLPKTAIWHYLRRMKSLGLFFYLSKLWAWNLLGNLSPSKTGVVCMYDYDSRKN
jgi:hypothetical protein